ncbi:hypothetical protein JL720_11206 [Aureococcus anophagefferens]|nr:hypothetical protein JL720_11206 [Aureococcus anophagefferens]
MPLSPEKGSSATNIMPADWAKDVQALVRRHKYNFDAAAKERLRDLENFAKKEAIFDRVLASLGGGDGDASSSVPSDVLEAFEKQRAEERERLERLDAKKKERDELR